jgi:Ser/Thr protein kinase RdoA (MazF antagonist)
MARVGLLVYPHRSRCPPPTGVRPWAGYPFRVRRDELLDNGAVTHLVEGASSARIVERVSIIDAVVETEALESTVRRMWHRRVRACEPVTGQVWRLALEPGAGPERVVAKWVPAARRARLLGGLAAAQHLSAPPCGAGVPTGVAVPAADGAIGVALHDGALVLLEEVPGRALHPADPVDQHLMGDVLGRVHRGLAGFHDPRLLRLGRLDSGLPHLRVLPGLADAVGEAAAALNRLTVSDQLTYGVVHGDPEPGAFRLDHGTGRLGLVGWGWAAIGLLLYDIAGVVGALGGVEAAGEFLDGYLAAGPVAAGEVAVGLHVVLRCRLARRADALARVLHAGHSADPQADRRALVALREQLAVAG